MHGLLHVSRNTRRGDSSEIGLRWTGTQNPLLNARTRLLPPVCRVWARRRGPGLWGSPCPQRVAPLLWLIGRLSWLVSPVAATIVTVTATAVVIAVVSSAAVVVVMPSAVIIIVSAPVIVIATIIVGIFSIIRLSIMSRRISNKIMRE